jgi:membrane-bound hydrogenase subunit beta
MALHHDEIIDRLKNEFGDDILGINVIERTEGALRKREQRSIAVSLTRKVFHRAVSYLKTLGTLHIACPMASREFDDFLELIYPFTLFSGEGDFSEIPVIIKVLLPEDDLSIRTVTDIIPGILFMERETMEMLGVVIEDIPDPRRLFTPNNLPDDFKPLREPRKEPEDDSQEIKY